ncbi:MAG: ribonuclease D [Xanthomonadales bacterium]|nr:ribonuclease D [Xanthomonadales bacterium]
MEAADSALVLASPSDISRAAKAWRKCGTLGVDTEFVRERTYYAQLGLVQVSDGQTVWLIDPLVRGSHAPIKDLLENEDIVKIFHSPSEDLDVLMNTVGAMPTPMLDTQLACALLGQPLQLAYHAMVRWLFELDMDNDQTRSNWVSRPLKPAQLHYAALDVCLLPLIWEILQQRLKELNRHSWLIEDCNAAVYNAGDQESTLSNWLRIRGVGRLDGESLAILERLYNWREEQARARDLPRGFIIKDPVLLGIARLKPGDIGSLREVEGLHPGAVRRYGEDLLALIRSVRDSGKSLPIIQQLNRSERSCLAQMKSLVGDKARDLGVEPAVLASRRELEAIMRQDSNHWPPKFRGWRSELIGKPLENLRQKFNPVTG